jgi:RNA polymerase sigma-70 factor (ECF subfamily)
VTIHSQQELSTVSEPESIWLTKALKGDPEAFTHLVEAYQRPVFNLCYRMLGNPGDAEDAAQETFLRAYRSLNRYDNRRPFPTWLLSIAAHYCIDQIRKQRMALVSMDELPDLDLPDLAPGPETAVSRNEEQQKVRVLLKALSPVDRAAVVMYYWYDFSYEEIAQALSLSLSAVKSRLHRARHDLAQHWIQQHPQGASLERNLHGELQTPAF